MPVKPNGGMIFHLIHKRELVETTKKVHWLKIYEIFLTEADC